MDVYTIFYYPVFYGIKVARDKSIPVADKVLFLNKPIEHKICRECPVECSQSFIIYRVDRIFIIKKIVNFIGEERNDEDYLFLTILTKNHEPVAIIDWINLLYETVSILPSYFLNEFIYNAIKKDIFDMFILRSEDSYEKEKRRFGFRYNYLSQIFKKELEELETKRKEKKIAKEMN